MIIKVMFFLFVAFSLLGNTSFAQFTSNWETFYSSDEVLIEVKSVQKEIATRDQNLIVFKIQNLTNETLKTTYKQHIYRGDFCHGCTSTNGEYDFELTLAPNQVINGEYLLKEQKALCVFNTFVHLVPGMSDIPVDKIDFVNITTAKL